MKGMASGEPELQQPRLRSGFERAAGIDGERHDAALGLADQQAVDETALLGAERDADHVADIALAGLDVEIADGGQGLALDYGHGFRPVGKAMISRDGGQRRSGAECGSGGEAGGAEMTDDDAS